MTKYLQPVKHYYVTFSPFGIHDAEIGPKESSVEETPERLKAVKQAMVDIDAYAFRAGMWRIPKVIFQAIDWFLDNFTNTREAVFSTKDEPDAKTE